MKTGYFHVGDDPGSAILPAAGCLDVAGVGSAFRSDAVWLRVYEHKTRPDPERYAEAGVIFLTAHRRPGQRVALVGGNEQNNPFETWGGTAADYREWFRRFRAKVTSLDDSIECWWAGMSPGFPDWLDWYAGCEQADGVALHLYGLNQDELMRPARVFTATYPGVIWGGLEINHGVGRGRECDRNVWAKGVLRPSLDDMHALGAGVALYFTYDGWTQDDPSVGQATPPIAPEP